MGKSITYTYRVEYRDQDGWHSQGWKGRASDVAAEKWRVAMNKSFNIGGSNWHVSEGRGIVLHVSHVRIVHQKTGRVVATAKMPMFEAA